MERKGLGLGLGLGHGIAELIMAWCGSAGLQVGWFSYLLATS